MSCRYSIIFPKLGFVLFGLMLALILIHPVYGQQNSKKNTPSISKSQKTQVKNQSTSTGMSQDITPFVGHKISSIDFKGLKNVSTNELNGVIQPYINLPLSTENFEKLQDALYSLPYFAGYINFGFQNDPKDADQVQIIFHVQEQPVVDQIIVKGNQTISTNNIVAKVLLKKGAYFSNIKWRQSVSAIEKLYKDNGFIDAQIDAQKKMNSQKSTINLVFNIDEGYAKIVKSIEYKGNHFASDGTLGGLIKTKTQGLFNRGFYNPLLIPEDKQAIVSFYQNNGYLKVKVNNVSVKTVSTDKKNRKIYLSLTYSIVEGPQYIFEGFIFKGNKIYTNKQLEAQVLLKKGSPVDQSLLMKTLENVENLYRNGGYFFNTFVGPTQSLTKNKVLYTLNITERSRAHIGKLVINGNNKTKKYVITRELPLEVGQIFKQNDLIQGLKNLYYLGYFSTVQPDIQMDPNADGLLDVTLNVKEKSTTQFNFGGSVIFTPNQFPFQGTYSFLESNFLGQGYQVKYSINLGANSQSVAATFGDQWLFNIPMYGSVSLSYNHTISEYGDQNLTGPLFNNMMLDNTSDPYDPDTWVYSDGSHAGQILPYVPSESEQKNGKLKNGQNIESRYDYDRDNHIFNTPNLMKIEQHIITLSGTLGYTFYTPVGRFGLGGSLQFSLIYTNFKNAIYRPSDYLSRITFQRWGFANVIGPVLTWDTRDTNYNPETGFLIRQNVGFAGLLLGLDYFTKLQTTADFYFRLFNLQFNSLFALKGVLSFRTGLGFIVNPLTNNFKIVAEPSQLFSVDGIVNARGWQPSYNGYQRFTFSVDYKMPIVQGYIWAGGFFDGALMSTNPDQFLFHLPADRYQFSFGFGLISGFSGFPLAIYFAKGFSISSSGKGVVWAKGNGIFGSKADYSLVVSVSSYS